MIEDINVVIQKNLPAHVGEILKERLDEANRLTAENSELKVKQKQLEDRINELTFKVEQYQKLKLDSEAVEAQRLANRKNADQLHIDRCLLDSEIIKAKYEVEKEKVADLKSVVALAFKSPVYHHSYNTNTNIPVKDSTGYISSFYQNSNGTTTTTTEV